MTFDSTAIITGVLLALMLLGSAVALIRTSAPSSTARQAQLILAASWLAGITVSNATRAVRYPSDMAAYLAQWREALSERSLDLYLGNQSADRGFSILIWATAHFEPDPRLFMACVASIICVAFAISAWVLIPKQYVLPVLFAVTVSPFFAFYLANTVRQGVAASLLVLGMSLAVLGRKWVLPATVVVIFAVTVHLSALVPAAAVVVMSLTSLSMRIPVVLWLGAAALYVSGLNSIVFAFIVGRDERFDGYAGGEALRQYAGGVNRVDFLLVSSAIAFSTVMLWRRLHARTDTIEVRDHRAARILAGTLLTWNAYFLCFGYLAFSDRFAAYSWLAAPLVLGYFVFHSEAQVSRTVRLSYVFGILFATLALQGWPDVLGRLPIVD